MLPRSKLGVWPHDDAREKRGGLARVGRGIATVTPRQEADQQGYSNSPLNAYFSPTQNHRNPWQRVRGQWSRSAAHTTHKEGVGLV